MKKPCVHQWLRGKKMLEDDVQVKMAAYVLSDGTR